MSKIFLCALLSLSAASVPPRIINATSLENKPGLDSVISATITILHLCQPKDPKMTLLLGGDYEIFLHHAFFNVMPIALIAESSSRFNALEKFALSKYSFVMYENYNFIYYVRKVHRFIMVASSRPFLRSILQRTKDSPWANSYGFYILIDTHTESRGCINARSYLRTAWEYDLLSVIFLCADPNDGIVHYTFNPYSNDTPASWLEVERVRGRNGHPWILLKRTYVQGEEMCTDLDFDKTTNLNGYEIRLNAVEIEPFLRINMSAPDREKFTGENSEIIHILLLKLKASLRIDVYEGNMDDLGHIGPNGTFEGMLRSLSEGSVDISMNARSLANAFWKLRYTYPHTISRICVITQSTKEISEFMKLVTFISLPVIVGILTVCSLTYVILARKQGYADAWLQVIRLMVCVGILRPPKINSSRIFVCMTLILLLNVNAIFQSHLSSLLTIPVFYRQIDTVEQLVKSGFSVYGSVILQNIINDPVIKKRFVSVPYDACKEHVQNSTTAGCFDDCLHAYYRIGDADLHKSRTLRFITQSYVTRENWPLLTRVDRIIQQLMQSGLIRHSRSRTFFGIQQARYKKRAKKNFKVMVLKQLAFCYYFLGIGYTCAAIVFILELVVGGSARGSQNPSGIVDRWKTSSGRTAEPGRLHHARGDNRMMPIWN